MKQTLPDSCVLPGHPDHALLGAIAGDITARAGGAEALAGAMGRLLRGCIDDVIMTAKTGRRSYDELEKTEKTYIGTRVEIELRALLGLSKGRLDTVILGHDVDIKHTCGGNWMIPTEAVGHPCILVATDEARAICHLALIVARRDYLTEGQNKDAKRTICAAAFANILWLLAQQPYPRNFWQTVPPDAVARIFAEKSGNRRMAALFREVQGRPIARNIVEAVAQQRDFMRRIRADGGSGTRDQLAREGVLLLSGQYDAALIAALGLRSCTGAEFISYRPKSGAQAQMAADHGLALTPTGI
ncbi:NaeI family type II restriction endonuclease [Roseovarius dicentrarchi]|uniref:NaeI family type II restriction endonuclease n=1 Tax=Roseovarius dicentrarchi TaxID=2250573 RepID=UPI000DE90FEA|nr:NaeI family type II restriction endonuclease [Roseovarius dicentrarchi]